MSSDSTCSPNGYDFKKIEFGKADALKEANTESLLVEGFLDAYGFLDEILYGDKYYVIGPKGSGKSAIGAKVMLSARNSSKISADVLYLEQFDYSGFSGVIPGAGEPTKKTLETWQFLIAAKFIEMYSNMELEYLEDSKRMKQICQALREIGLLPSVDFNTLIDRMKHRDFKFSFKGFSLESSSKIQNTDIRRMISNVIDAFYSISPRKKCFIFIDGLDSILGKRESEYQILSGLIHVTDIINTNLIKKDINSKPIVLCRDDVLDKLKDPNKTKFIQDSGIILDWHQDVAEVRETNLNKLLDLRAKVSLGADVSVVDEFLPSSVKSEDHSSKDILKYLLDYTRMIPRDIIQLMNNIQNVSYAYGASTSSIKNGIRKYSEGYFYSEVTDALVGMISNKEIELSFNAIRSVGKIETDSVELINSMGVSKDDGVRILSALYDAGAIINYKIVSGKRFYTSKFRNRHSTFNENNLIMVHSGLHKAFSLGNDEG